MKKTYIVIGLLLATVIIYNCSETKNATQTYATNPYPVRTFDSTPSVEYLDPAASLKSFNLPFGYHLELVASEPMIKEPVAIAWDGNARMYVAEMLTYMLDADAKGEQVNVSRISLLEDTNNDGKMDKSSIFIDSLLLPRMILCVNHELLVNETNTITINAYKDTDGDGKADQKRTVFQKEGYRLLDANMEHQRSGLDWNLDNYIYLTYDPVRFRYKNGMLEADSLYSGPGGQWGVTHDNYGRLFLTNAGSESPLVRPQMNPSYGALDMPDQANNEFQQVWPIVATPDVQGGLPRLRADSTLNHFTGACGQSIYRGNTLPQDFSGDYIICEPVARIIRRAKVINLKGKVIVQNAYYRQEFFASTDMNFRPVNSYTGPDGNLYIVDMHRGIIQQGNWTRPGSYLRKKIDAMGMAKNTGHGRIYRLVYDGHAQSDKSDKPHMLDEPAAKLVNYLDHKNGWWRDNAQKQIVLLNDKSVVPTLKQIVKGEQATLAAKPSHLARLHALWTLDGLDALDRDILYTALKDEHPQIRKAAVILSEPYLQKDDDDVMAKLVALKNDPSYDVRLQLFLSTYSIKSAKSAPLAAELLAANTSNEMFAAAQKAMDRNIDLRTYGNRLGNLPPDERKSIIAGSAIFNSLCVSCHGAGGKGMTVAGSNSLAAPVLVDSKRMNTDKATLVKIMLHGLQGPIEGKEYPSVMPSLGANSDEWVASAVNYIRYEFGNASRRFRRPGDTTSPFVSISEVASVRKQYETRTALWTLEELETGNATAVVAKTSADSPSTKIVTAPPKTTASKKPAAKTTAPVKKIDYAAVAPLLQKYTCLTCHQANNKVIGPSYSEVAARKYSVAQIVQLIQKPNPANWPGYDTKMPPMAHVPANDLTQIAQWIKSLEKAK